jgi:hypothetical protein
VYACIGDKNNSSVTSLRQIQRLNDGYCEEEEEEEE